MNKRLLRRTDFTLILAVGAIIILSLVIIGSATHINEAASGQRFAFVERQGFFAVLNIALAAFFMNVYIQSYPFDCGNAYWSFGSWSTEMDTDWTCYIAAFRVCKAHYDSIPGLDA